MAALPTLGRPQPPLPLPSNLAEAAGSTVQGHFSNTLVFLYTGSKLDVVNAVSNELVCSHDFGNKSDDNTEDVTNDIICCLEINTSNRHLVAVGLESGLICLLELTRSLVILRIRLPKPISAMALVAADRQQANQRILAEQLLFLDGILALGTKGGHLYLLDLAFDALEDEQFEEQSEMEEHNVRFILPHSLVVGGQGGGSSLADVREQEMGGSCHLCMRLNDKLFVRGSIEHISSENGESSFFPERRVSITCLAYLPQLASIVVGFNYGGWQLWNTNRLMMEYSSLYVTPSQTSLLSTDIQFLPVVRFTLVEPEEDPKSLCYLCVMHSEHAFPISGESYCVDSLAGIHLFSLCYQNRLEDEQFGVFFTSLINCELRLCHKLTEGLQQEMTNRDDGVATRSIGVNMFNASQMRSTLQARVLGSGTTNQSAAVVDEPSSSINGLSNIGNNGANRSDIGIIFFLWQVFNGEDDRSLYYFGLFDINAWYQAQIPDEVYLTDSTQCSFFSVCPLNDVLTTFAESNTAFADRLLDINIKDVTAFTTLSQAESHFYPSSVAFEMRCLSERSIVKVYNLGLQGKVLSELECNGHLELCEPRNLYELCSIAGLLQRSNVLDENDDLFQPRESAVEHQRRKLLDIALENNRAQLLINCLRHWDDGKLLSAGCTRGFLLNWAWNQVVSSKHTIDKATVPLFDYSTSRVDERLLKLFFNIKQKLGHLCSMLIVALEGHSDDCTEAYEELKEKLEAAKKVKLYVTAIVWFANFGLLPEMPEATDESTPSRLFYPSNAMREMYRPKRARNKAQTSNFSYLGEASLMIDHLCNAMGTELRERYEASEGLPADEPLYPPPSLHALLTSYLVESSSEIDKHNVVHYFFLDLASLLAKDENLTPASLDQLIKFPSAFGVPPSSIKLTQAFWLLDHEDFEEAFYMLLDPLISKTDISLVQHRAILMAFLSQGAEHLALKYSTLRPPQPTVVDVQLHLAILLANGMALEAFEYQRRHITACNASQMLPLFFMNVQHLGKLELLLQTSFTAVEEQQLFKFLQSNINGQETMLTYLLRRSRFTEAWQLYQALNESHPNEIERRKQIMIDFYKSKEMSLPKKGLSILKGDGKSSKKTILPNRLHAKFEQGTKTPATRDVKVSQTKKSATRIGSENKADNGEHKENECTIDTQGMATFPAFTPFRPRGKRRRQRVEVEEIDDESKTDGVSRAEDKDTNSAFQKSLLATPVTQSRQISKKPAEEIVALLSTPVIVKKKLDQIADGNSTVLPTSIMKSGNNGMSTKRSWKRNDEDEQTWLLNLNPSKSLRFDFPEEDNEVSNVKSKKSRQNYEALASEEAKKRKRLSQKQKRQSLAQTITSQMLQRRSQLLQVEDEEESRDQVEEKKDSRDQEEEEKGSRDSSTVASKEKEDDYVMTEDEDSEDNREEHEADREKSRKYSQYTKSSFVNQTEPIESPRSKSDIHEEAQKQENLPHLHQETLVKAASGEADQEHHGHLPLRQETELSNDTGAQDPLDELEERTQSRKAKEASACEQQQELLAEMEQKSSIDSLNSAHLEDDKDEQPRKREGSEDVSLDPSTSTSKSSLKGVKRPSVIGKRRSSAPRKSSRAGRKSIAHSLLTTVLESRSSLIPSTDATLAEEEEPKDYETEQATSVVKQDTAPNNEVDTDVEGKPTHIENRSEAEQGREPKETKVGGEEKMSEVTKSMEAKVTDTERVSETRKDETQKVNEVESSTKTSGEEDQAAVAVNKGESPELYQQTKGKDNIGKEDVNEVEDNGVDKQEQKATAETASNFEGNDKTPEEIEEADDGIHDEQQLELIEKTGSKTDAHVLEMKENEEKGKNTEVQEKEEQLDAEGELIEGAPKEQLGEKINHATDDQVSDGNVKEKQSLGSAQPVIPSTSTTINEEINEPETPRRSARQRNSSVRFGSPVTITEGSGRTPRKKTVSMSATQSASRNRTVSSSSSKLPPISETLKETDSAVKRKRKKSASAKAETRTEHLSASPDLRPGTSIADVDVESKDKSNVSALETQDMERTSTTSAKRKKSSSSRATVSETPKINTGKRQKSVSASSRGRGSKTVEVDASPKLKSGVSITNIPDPTSKQTSLESEKVSAEVRKDFSTTDKSSSKASAGTNKESSDASKSEPKNSPEKIELPAEKANTSAAASSTPSVRRSARLMHNESGELGSVTLTDDDINLSRSTRCRSESPTTFAVPTAGTSKRKKSSSTTNIDTTRKRRTMRLSTVKEVDDGYQPFSPLVEQQEEGQEAPSRTSRRSSIARRSVYKPLGSKTSIKKFKM